jgi:putative SOS response-associated peptidase YedK
MCNRYHPARVEIIRMQWQLGEPQTGDRTWRPGIGPFGVGPFIRIKPSTDEPELVVGTWALIGDDSAQPVNRARSTNNARWETIAKLKTFIGPWTRGQRCLIPAERFDYPNWESGKNEWWTFRRADGEPWHLAGIWNAWTDKATGEVFESYSMVTMNCDAHPLLSRFHKPEPDLPPHAQDKRTVVPIEVADHRAWLTGSLEEAAALVRLRPVETYDARPASAPPPEQMRLG